MSIIAENLTHVYMQGSPFESTALENINLEIKEGEFVGLIGHTGSGKSTLIQHFNGLLKPTSGKIIVNGINAGEKGKDLKILRQHVGLVFQYPEHQLFEETVYQDIAFGPKNLGLSQETIKDRVEEAMSLVGLDFNEIKDRSPFEISGGQRRRTAIAGVLAMKPKILILDEPTAGLDPRGRDEIFGRIKDLHIKSKITIILVSHSMEDIAKLVQKVIVMNKGKIALTGSLSDVFRHSKKLESMGLGIPQITQLMHALRKKGADLPEDIYSVQQAKNAIINMVRGRSNA
jgi:energy-coupling factor transport system ATP-binding protein